MNNKLFVGGLPFSTTEDQLRAHFEQYGEITSVKIITDRDTGRSRGFGFVEFVDEAGATAALQADGSMIAGTDRAIRVTAAKPQEARPPRENRW